MVVMETEVYDTCAGSEVEPKDFIRYDGHDYIVAGVDDEGELISLFVEPLDSNEDDDTIILDPFEEVELVRYA
jgi:hypothetical protein